MMSCGKYCVYIMSNKYRNVFYIGVTNNMSRRYSEHKNGVCQGFTKRYNCTELIYFEQYDNMMDAIIREKQLKAYRREKKEMLVKRVNPEMLDLGDKLGLW